MSTKFRRYFILNIIKTIVISFLIRINYFLKHTHSIPHDWRQIMQSACVFCEFLKFLKKFLINKIAAECGRTCTGILYICRILTKPNTLHLIILTSTWIRLLKPRHSFPSWWVPLVIIGSSDGTGTHHFN